MHKVLRWTDASSEAQHDSSSFEPTYDIPHQTDGVRIFQVNGQESLITRSMSTHSD